MYVEFCLFACMCVSPHCSKRFLLGATCPVVALVWADGGDYDDDNDDDEDDDDDFPPLYIPRGPGIYRAARPGGSILKGSNTVSFKVTGKIDVTQT